MKEFKNKRTWINSLKIEVFSGPAVTPVKELKHFEDAFLTANQKARVKKLARQ